MKHGKVIGVGNTATTYEWQEGRVLKLFNEGYPKEAVELEFGNVRAINNMSFAKPVAHEMISYEGRIGIIYDRVEGESLLDWVMKTGDLQKCAVYMADLHKEILRNSISNVPGYKEFLRTFVSKALSVDSDIVKESLDAIERLPDGDTLCHGDFHPGNILISYGKASVIDFMNVCHGEFLYDVARTVFLVEYTPVPEDIEYREVLLNQKRTLADLYLKEMNVTREMIKDYLSVIIAARRGECPDEF